MPPTRRKSWGPKWRNKTQSLLLLPPLLLPSTPFHSLLTRQRPPPQPSDPLHRPRAALAARVPRRAAGSRRFGYVGRMEEMQRGARQAPQAAQHLRLRGDPVGMIMDLGEYLVCLLESCRSCQKAYYMQMGNSGDEVKTRNPPTPSSLTFCLGQPRAAHDQTSCS